MTRQEKIEIYIIAVILLILGFLILPLTVKASINEDLIRTKLKALTYEAAYMAERSKTLLIEAAQLEAELQKIIKEKEDKRNEKNR